MKWQTWRACQRIWQTEAAKEGWDDPPLKLWEHGPTMCQSLYRMLVLPYLKQSSQFWQSYDYSQYTHERQLQFTGIGLREVEQLSQGHTDSCARILCDYGLALSLIRISWSIHAEIGEFFVIEKCPTSHKLSWCPFL